jgi:hypothetical protein
MHHLDLRVQLLAGFSLFVATATNVETFLRFSLLILSIAYTSYKLYDSYVEKKKKCKLKDNDIEEDTL